MPRMLCLHRGGGLSRKFAFILRFGDVPADGAGCPSARLGCGESQLQPGARPLRERTVPTNAMPFPAQHTKMSLTRCMSVAICVLLAIQGLLFLFSATQPTRSYMLGITVKSSGQRRWLDINSDDTGPIQLSSTRYYIGFPLKWYSWDETVNFDPVLWSQAPPPTVSTAWSLTGVELSPACLNVAVAAIAGAACWALSVYVLGRRIGSKHCASCGYDVQDLVRCPECGSEKHRFV